MSNVYETSPAHLFAADPTGKLLQVSRALREHLDAPLTADARLDALGQPEDAEALAGLLAAVAETDAVHCCTIHVATRAGTIERMRCQVRRTDDGTIHGVLDHEFERARIERRLLRAAMDTLDIVMSAIEPDGTFIFHDGKALASVGMQRDQLVGHNLFELYTPEQAYPAREALAGKPSHARVEAHGVHWETWTIPMYAETGEIEYSASVSLDITEIIRTQLELRQQLETIRKQQEAIRELSTPLIEVWDHVLAVPLVGTIHDPDRIGSLAERLLQRVSSSSVRFVLLDLTGVESVDTVMAADILRIVRSLSLIGSEGLLTGLSPVVAQTLASLGVELDAVKVRRTLRDGLRYCTGALHS